MSTQRKSELDGRHAIEDVRDPSRMPQNRYGSAGLAAAVEAAWAANCYKVSLATGLQRESTSRFYEKAGFERNARNNAGGHDGGHVGSGAADAIGRCGRASTCNQVAINRLRLAGGTCGRSWSTEWRDRPPRRFVTLGFAGSDYRGLIARPEGSYALASACSEKGN